MGVLHKLETGRPHLLEYETSKISHTSTAESCRDWARRIPLCVKWILQWNRIPENYPKKNAFWNPGGPVLVQNVRGLPWSFRAKLEMPIVPLGGCQVKKSYSKPSAEAENVTRGSSGRVKK